ncbi:deleted in malignant brain tumors 1 protein-like [Dendronephthya gigantea]|uniref:deleted in malignant brain tumors 1 protein-like n=1 Tax=Dendronephthya gigantea TaxID=151771 RepID=UPI00106B423B|nr:deleted in malignant brain tumors 1 protein-like [Dendronephthya gigantea]XP_028414893.1 deleted in malignant brain tumors 1 protein-like [Dendronephthya gigantea]
MMSLAIITGVIFGLCFVSHHCEGTKVDYHGNNINILHPYHMYNVTKGHRNLQKAITVPVRLQGPRSANGTGRVEVFYNGTWGTICNDGWDIRDARVVCRQLGYIDSGMVLSSQQFPNGSGEIWLKNVDCTGEEETLTSCSHSGWGVSDSCHHYKDVGVECFKTAVQLRLQGPSSSNGTGRVEVFYNGRWGTICDYKWDMEDARVACRQLGYNDVARVLYAHQVPSGSGVIWLSEMDCTGGEQNITSCFHASWAGYNFCSHRDDAGVECTATDFSTTPVRLRLQGPLSVNGSGRVEVLYHGYWGTICAIGWDIKIARVVCRQLGYQDAVRTLLSYEVPYTSGMKWLSKIVCTGEEENITSCAHKPWEPSDLCIQQPASVECSRTDFTGTPVRLRLQGPLSANGTGLVEVLYHGYWWKISGYYWNKKNAKVACRQLGYNPDNAKTLKSNLVPASSDLVWLKHVSCTGDERNLANCSHDAWGPWGPYHVDEFASVQCSATDFTAVPLRLRLQGPLSAYGIGRVEVFYYGQWGTICARARYHGWHMRNASIKVICRQLGYYDAVRALRRDEVPLGSGRIWLDFIFCSGNEEKIENCYLSSWGDNHCSHENDVGVECTASVSVKSKSGKKSNQPKSPILMTIPAIIVVGFIIACVAIVFHRQWLRKKNIKVDSKTRQNPVIFFLPKDEHVIILNK